MPRGLRVGNFDVYVLDERGQRHHLPHAHIKQKGRQVATVFLITLEMMHAREKLPADLLKGLQEAHADLLNLWVELNGND